MKLYSKLSGVTFLRKYSFKFLFIAFLGIHIPLLGIIIFIALGPGSHISALQIILVALALTLLATGVTLLILNQLIAPIHLAKEALHNYLYDKKLPRLPVHYTDEAGILLRDMQYSLSTLDNLLSEKKDIISILSHDLRSPANSVLGAITLLREEREPAQQEIIYTHIEQSAYRQLSLIESMLTILRNEESILEDSSKESLPLSYLLGYAQQQLSLSFSDKNIHLTTLFPEDLKVTVNHDLFIQVLTNLLGNSLKFSPAGSKIEVSAHEQNGRVLINLRDHGIGFDDWYASRLFDRFTKAGRTGTKGESSNGIGLYICKKIMEKHQGSIAAHSDGPHMGATFTLTLPA